MIPSFDPKTYVPHYGALEGFAMVHGLDLKRFEDLLKAEDLASIDARLVGIPDASGWRRHLIYDACVARYGSFGGVVEALGAF